jgi:hypothetical protein
MTDKLEKIKAKLFCTSFIYNLGEISVEDADTADSATVAGRDCLKAV